MIKHLNVKVYGRVQGVFFRHSTKIKAEELDIKGFARNEPDGTVYIEAEAEEENLKKFLEWCRQRYQTPSVLVEKVEYEFKTKIKGFNGFQIL